MQKNMYWLLLIGMFIASCGTSKKDKDADLNDKKSELAELKNEQKELSTKIARLEGEIALLDTSAAKTENPKLVAISPIATGKFDHFIEIQGRVDAENISYVSPSGQPAVVKALYVKEGQTVRKGQVLAKLDDQLVRQQMEPIRVQLSSAEDTYRRTKNLFDQGVGTYQSVLNAKTQVESLRKQLGIFQQQITQTSITAPASGVAEEVNVRVGEIFVGVIGNTAQIKIVNTSDLKITAEVPENYLGRVDVGSTLEIILPDENNRVITTKVNRTSKVINPNTRTFTIEAKIPSTVNLKPNQLAKVHIKDYESNNAITIPMNTLQNDETGKFVMMAVNEKGRLIARKRTVTVGELYNDRLEIKSGLQPGDQLITEGFQSLYDGQLITTQAK